MCPLHRRAILGALGRNPLSCVPFDIALELCSYSIVALNLPQLFRYEKILNEMLSHLERQPRNKERRVAWLKLIEPLLQGVGLVLLAHFRRIFPLIFQWMHADDDETVVLVRTIKFPTT